MAPVNNNHRTAAPTKSILKKSSQPKKLEYDALFPSNKKDKQKIRHAQLVSKIEKSSKAKPRKRRPNKKLVTTLDALADALPDTDDVDEGSKKSGVAGSRPEDQVNVIKRKSIKSRPGAMKRREKLDKTERDRFAKNLAQMTSTTSAVGSVNGGTGGPVAPPKPEDKWKALRGFIEQTMEKKPEMKGIMG